MQVISSIVTYNPDLSRLKENIEAILPQVNEIVVVDNGSKNLQKIKGLLGSYDNIHIITNAVNLGIATALNQAAQYAYEQSYSWLLTLDQDSITPSNLIKTYDKYVGDDNVGMISCKIIDRNFGQLDYDKKDVASIEEIEMCITSASLLNVKAWKSVGGFKEKLFIDAVDYDLCLTLREHGYKILRTNDVSLLHEVGHSQVKHVLGKDRQIFHHNPIRYYYMVRNGIYLGKAHHFLFRAIGRVTKMAFFTLLYDDSKWAKAKMMLLGCWHFIIGKYGKLQ